MTPRFRRIAVPLITASLLGFATACGGGGGGATGADAAPAEKIKRTINLVGDFGFKPLYEGYKKTHPNIENVENVTQFNDQHNNRDKRLDTHAGPGDRAAA